MSPDFKSHYRTLFTEATDQLRAQNQVLKKAVIEEQAKSSQISDVLKSKDQSLRKADQENDSLTFRNQQLTKRLTLLQEDLDVIQNKGKKSKVKQESVSADGIIDGNDVFTEELQAKIKENARLHAQLADTEQMYRTQLAEMEGKLDDVQKDLQKKQDSQQVTQIAASERVDQLEAELVAKELSHQRLLKELSLAKEELDRLQQQIMATTETSKIPTTNQAQESTSQNEVQDVSLPDQIDSRDTSCSAMEQLFQAQQSGPPPLSPATDQNKLKSDLNINCNQLSRDVRVSAKILVQTFDVLIQEMCDAFVKFLQGFMTRVNLHPSNSGLKQRLLEQLSSGLSVWHSLSTSYHQVAMGAASETFVALETLSGLPSVSQNVTYCSASLRKLLPAMIHWLHDGRINVDISSPDKKTEKHGLQKIPILWGKYTPPTLAVPSLTIENQFLFCRNKIFSIMMDRMATHAGFREIAQV
ncbi:unnamed protein product, partial [Meganyctiphanes norvegica]